MPRKVGNSPKAHQEKLREQMRGYGCTVAQIAAEMGRRFNLRPRTAWRLALGWQQWKVAQQYNTCHPGAKLGDNRVSEYETWPHGGSRPSLRYLVRLAATYGHGCTPADLVDAEDLARFTPAERCLLTTGDPSPRTTDERTFQNTATPGTLVTTPSQQLVTSLQPQDTRTLTLPAASAGELVLPVGPALWTAATGFLPLPDDLTVLLVSCLATLSASDDDALVTPHAGNRVYHRLVRLLTRWAHTVKRRLMLRGLGWAVTAASVGHVVDPDEQARVAAVLGNPGRVDAATLEHFETILWGCKRLDDTLGPRGVLETVLIQSDLLHTLLPDCPADLRPRLLSALSVASRLAGWFSFDLYEFDSATSYYEDARAQAHEAENIELGALTLSHMSLLALRRGTPRIGIDHAVAAEQWAGRSGDLRVRALCADGAARAYAVNGQRGACLTALDAAEKALSEVGDQVPGYIWRYSEEVHFSKCGECHLALGDADRAADYAQQSLATLDPSFTRITALTIVDLARAYTQSQEIDESARLLGDAADIAARNSSIRLIDRVKQGRAELQPWADTTAVRNLDERIRSYGLVIT